MTEEKNLKINTLPSPTYRWLKMNEAVVQAPKLLSSGELAIQNGTGYSLSLTSYAELLDIPGGMGYDMDLMMSDSASRVYKIQVPSGSKVADSLRIRIDYEDMAARGDVLYVELMEDAELSLILDFHCAEGTDGFAAMQTKLRLGKNSKLKLTQVQRLPGSIRFLNDLGVRAEENVCFEQIQLSLSGENCYWGSRTDLIGRKSSLKTDIGYLLKGRERLDMNYIANHIGKKTECLINADGVLRDQSFKLFRGTIDLRRGAKGAVGNELETVLLMDEGVINQTIPVILCTEDDVEGNHGATIGRLDESLLFYLESRGMDRDAVYEMMAKAKLDSVIAKLPDMSLRQELLNELYGEEDNVVS